MTEVLEGRTLWIEAHKAQRAHPDRFKAFCDALIDKGVSQYWRDLERLGQAHDAEMADRAEYPGCLKNKDPIRNLMVHLRYIGLDYADWPRIKDQEAFLYECVRNEILKRVATAKKEGRKGAMTRRRLEEKLGMPYGSANVLDGTYKKRCRLN